MSISKSIAGIVTAIGLAFALVAVAAPAQALPTTPAPTTTASGRNVTVTDGYFTSGDQYGTQIYFKENVVTNPVGNAIVVHGMAEHQGRYEYVTEKLNNAGFNVFRLDHRGHGRSAEPYVDNVIKRSHIDDYQNLLDDMNILVEKAKAEQPNLKTIMVGHSLGAFATQGYALKYPDALDSTVTNGGGIPLNLTGKVGQEPNEVISAEISEAEVESFSPLSAIPLDKLTTLNAQYLEAALQDRNFRVESSLGSDLVQIPNPLSLGIIDAAWDPAVREDMDNDPLNNSTLGLGLLEQTVALMLYNSINASQFTLPTHNTHGDKDELVPVSLEYNWSNANSSSDEAFTIYKGQMHEVWNDYAKDETLDDVVAWMLDRVK